MKQQGPGAGARRKVAWVGPGVNQFWIIYDGDSDAWYWYLGDSGNNWVQVRTESSAAVGMEVGTRVWAGGETVSTNSQLGVLFHNELAVYRYNGGQTAGDIYASQYKRFVPDDPAPYRSHCGNRYYTTYNSGGGQRPGGEGSVSVSTNGSATCP